MGLRVCRRRISRGRRRMGLIEVEVEVGLVQLEGGSMIGRRSLA